MDIPVGKELLCHVIDTFGNVIDANSLTGSKTHR
jgi:F0F1-type ATP synthase beta subunit